MEGGLASALFTTHRPQEELLPLILATAFPPQWGRAAAEPS